ncbi:MAG: protein-disulfide reductase DsbD domain-containing protein [Roseiarcus sp.]|jgi:DsbC/DsbD-like thiol-disulfide interchange protein
MFARFLLSCALVCCAADGVRAADAFSTDWARTLKADARLIAGGPGLAAFEIRLAPGAVTYWRDPGDSGAPPSFDFSRSVNLARAEPEFPAPERIFESDGSQAFGYEKAVIFPIAVEALDPSKPVTLAVNATYAVCEKICLPAKANLTLTLSESAATPYAASIAAARASTPRRVDWRSLGAELASIDARDWRLCLPAEPGPARDLFIEAPSGWWLSTKAEQNAGGRDCFAIALREKPADGAFPVAARATITGGTGALDVTLTLAPKS